MLRLYSFLTRNKTIKNFKVVISIAVVTALAFTSACDNANNVLTEPVATVTSVVGTDKNGDPIIAAAP